MSNSEQRERAIKEGGKIVDSIRLIQAGIRTPDPAIGRAGYERLANLMGRAYALNVVVAEALRFEEEQMASSALSKEFERS